MYLILTGQERGRVHHDLVVGSAPVRDLENKPTL
jgi:hypothetical protein